MSFADFYFKRYKTNNQYFNNNEDSNLGIVVIIPCFNDLFILETLKSLNEAHPSKSKVEVIVVVNSSFNTPKEVVDVNRSIFVNLKERAETIYYKNFSLLPILLEEVSPKVAGVGYARKVAMDEAVRRFNSVNNPNGLIVSLDADCLVDKDYFRKIEEKFILNPNLGACTLQFIHNFEEKQLSSEIISACKLYEIYLRYFRLALKYANFPFPIHTIGSCFVVKASIYVKAGGMSHRQAGEDFYFLHKLMPITHLEQISKPLVFPSPRISDRVPFGTGPSVKKIVLENEYKVYNFKLFKIIKQFYSNIDDVEKYPKEIIYFLGEDKLKQLILDCRKNTGSKASFIKRMYTTFDAFFVIKFLNSFDEHTAFPKESVISVVANLFREYDIPLQQNADAYHEKILELDINN